jgi:hypothetical protein
VELSSRGSGEETVVEITMLGDTTTVNQRFLVHVVTERNRSKKGWLQPPRFSGR